MSAINIIEENPPVALYQNKNYAIQVAANWYLKEIDENQTLFFGPKVGETRIGFYITMVEKDGKNYLDAAERTKLTQKSNAKYTILEEQDLSEKSYKVFMRRSSWFVPDIDMTLFVREIFTESTTKVFILSCSIPNSPNLKELDSATVNMMNTFRIN